MFPDGGIGDFNGSHGQVTNSYGVAYCNLATPYKKEA